MTTMNYANHAQLMASGGVCPVANGGADLANRRASVSSTDSNTSKGSAATNTSASFTFDLGSLASDDFASNMLDLLNHETRDVIKATWAMSISRISSNDITPVATFVGLFFAKFFELCPEASLVFGYDMARQGKSLTNILTIMLENLVNPKKLQKNLKNIAKIHVVLGITPEMFVAFGKALNSTLSIRLGQAWNAQTERAWTDGYGGVSGLIVRAMEDVTLQPSDIPPWMIERYRQHYVIMKKSWTSATESDNGDRVLNAFFKHFAQSNPQGSQIYMRADARLRKVILWAAVTKIFDALESPRSLKSELKSLGISHAKMGVNESMLIGFGEAIRLSLKEILGDAYTQEINLVWIRCYRLLSLTLALVIQQNAGASVSLHSSRKGGNAKECSIQ